MRVTAKCIREVQELSACRLSSVAVMYKVFNGKNELGRCRSKFSKAVLISQNDLVVLKMNKYRTMDDVFEVITADSCKRDWTIVLLSVSLRGLKFLNSFTTQGIVTVRVENCKTSLQISPYNPKLVFSFFVFH